MLESIYELYSTSQCRTFTKTVCDDEASPLLVVAMLKTCDQHRHVLQFDREGRELLTNMTASYPSSNYMFVIDARCCTPEVFAVITEGFNALREVSPKLCYVLFAAHEAPEVFVSCTSVFNPVWISELRRLLDGLRNPRRLIAELLLCMGLFMRLEGLFQLIAECRRVGDASLVANLLPLTEFLLNDSMARKDNSGLQCSTLQANCTCVVERVEAGSLTRVLQTGIHLGSTMANFSTSSTSSQSGLQKKTRLLLVVLHAGGPAFDSLESGSTECDSSVEEVKCLVERLDAVDEVFVSLSGDVVLPLCPAATAQQQWREMGDVISKRVRQGRPANNIVMQKMISQAAPILRKWRTEQRAHTAGDKRNTRAVVLLYTAEDPCSVYQQIHYNIHDQLLFFQIPVLCVAVQGGTDIAYKLLNLSSRIGVRCICTVETDCVTDVIKDGGRSICGKQTKDAPKRLSSFERLGCAVLVAVRGITHIDVSVIVSSADNSKERACFDVGDLHVGSDAVLCLSRPMHSREDETCVQQRILLSAYSVEKGEYDAMCLTPPVAVMKVPSSVQQWWEQLQAAKKLLESVPSTVAVRERCLENDLTDQAQEGRNIEEFELRQAKLVKWLQSNYYMQQTDNIPYTMVVGWCPSPCSGEAAAPKDGCSLDSQQRHRTVWCSANPLVEFRWTNFPLYNGAPLTTVTAIISRTYPFEVLSESLASKTLALECLKGNYAGIRIASMKQIPELRNARARFIALLSVDMASGAMSLQQLASAKNVDDVRGCVLHSFRSLQLQQMYCVVHIALRCSLNSSFFLQDDVIIADGITFITAKASVRDVKVTPISHSSAEVEWKGTATSVKIVCTPLKWLWKGNRSSVRDERNGVQVNEEVTASTVTPLVQYSCDEFRCVIRGLQPLTVYHLCINPVMDSPCLTTVGERAEEASGYFATGVNVSEWDSLRVESIAPDGADVKLTVSHPLFRGVAIINRLCLLAFTITPVITVSETLVREKSYRISGDKNVEDSRVVAVFNLRNVEEAPVRIALDMKLSYRPSYEDNAYSTDADYGCKGDDEQPLDYELDFSEWGNDTCVWFAGEVFPTTKDIIVESYTDVSPNGPLVNATPALPVDADRISDHNIPCAEVESKPSASFDPDKPPSEENVNVVERDEREECEEVGWSESSGTLVGYEKGLLKYIVNGSDSSSVGEVARSQYCVFSKDHAFKGVCFVTDVGSKVLLANFRVGCNGNGYLSAVVEPLNVSLDNLDGDNTSMKVSYAHIDPEVPLTVKLVQHLEQRYQRVGKRTMHLYAITNIVCRCRREMCRLNSTKGKKVLLSWTCAAQQEGSSLSVLLGSKAHTPKPNNTLMIDCSDLTGAVPVRFCGSNIIRETCPIFFVPPPPPLCSKHCVVKAVEDDALHIFIAKRYFALLHRYLSCVGDHITVLLHAGDDGIAELPLSQQGAKEEETGVHLRLPLETVDLDKGTIALRIEVRADTGVCDFESGSLTSDWKDDGGSSGSRSQNSLIATNFVKESCRRPVLLIPCGTSHVFDAQVTSSVLIKNICVSELHCTKAKLSWTTVPKRGDTDEKLGVYLTVQCAAAEGSFKKYKEYVVCSVQSCVVRGLLPATPYHVEVCLDAEGPSEHVMFVTPWDMERDMLQKMIPSITTVWASRRGRNWQHLTGAILGGCGNQDRGRFVRLQLKIPHLESKQWRISPNFVHLVGDEYRSCSSVRIEVTANAQVLLVAKSGKLLQLWSTTSGLEKQDVSFAFPMGGECLPVNWPHLELMMDSFVEFSAEKAGEEGGSGGPLRCKQSVGSFSEKNRVGDARVNRFFATKHQNDKIKTSPTANSVIIHLVGCARLSQLDENRCVIEWGGSCSAYAIHWRVGPTGVVHTEYVEVQQKRAPSLTVDVSTLSAVVVLFCLHGAACTSNCVLFAVLVPPKISKQIEELSVTSVVDADVTSLQASKKELVRVEYARGSQLTPTLAEDQFGDHRTTNTSDSDELCCTMTVMDTSSPEWRDGFRGLLKDDVCYVLHPSPVEVIWLNPVVRAFFRKVRRAQ